MMKKVLYGVALALLACGPVCTLQSCKDDVSDLKTQTSYDLKELQNKINAAHDALWKQVNKNTADILALNGLSDQVTANKNNILQNTAAIQKLQSDLDQYAKVSWVRTQLQNLITAMENQYTSLDGKISDVATVLGQTNTRVANLTAEQQKMLVQIEGILNEITSLKATDTNLQLQIDQLKKDDEELRTAINGNLTKITALEKKYALLEARVAANEKSITSILNTLTELDTRLAAAEGRLDTAEGRLDLNEAAIKELRRQVEANSNSLNVLKQEVVDIKVALSSLDGRVDAIETRLKNVEFTLNELSGRIDVLISNILIQAADSPVFGNFSLPLGVKSTLLFNWYGENIKDIKKFPSTSRTYEYRPDGGVILESFPGMVEPIDINTGVIGDVNLGRLYLTINPAGHYFNPQNFNLETSKGTRIRNLSVVPQKCNEELYFGYTRAEGQEIEGNGFYYADVMISGDEDQRSEGVQDARIEIDDNLKSAVKDALKDRTKRNAIELLKAVYGQIHQMLPAYGVRYDWTSGTSNYSVLSNYDLAVATAKPLSYGFLWDKHSSKKLPTFGHLNNVFKNLEGKFTIKFKPLKADGITVTIPEIPLSNITVEGPTLHFEFEPIYIKDDHGTVIGSGTPALAEGTLETIKQEIAGSMQATINELTGRIEGWSGTASAQITTQLQNQLGDIFDDINVMVEDMQGQINDMIGDVVNKAEPWFNRLNRVVDLYNRFANKVNNVLEDPNHYLQVAMFYNQADSNIGMLSNNIDSPTPFKGSNGNVGLYASSYSGEIVCPAFKKYVAVTKVYHNDAQKTEASTALLTKVNNTAENFNKVVDGNTVRYAIPVSAFESGYIYEITYQGLDYSGVTSTQKFYITVN